MQPLLKNVNKLVSHKMFSLRTLRKYLRLDYVGLGLIWQNCYISCHLSADLNVLYVK